MKITFKVLYFSLFFFLSNLLYAETNVAYINLDKIYNESNAGKFILDEILIFSILPLHKLSAT